MKWNECMCSAANCRQLLSPSSSLLFRLSTLRFQPSALWSRTRQYNELLFAADANDSILQMAAADNGKRHFTSLSPSSLSTGHHHHHQHWQGDRHSSGIASDRQRKRLEQTAGSLSCARTSEHQVTLVLVPMIGARWHLSPVMCRQKLQQSSAVIIKTQPTLLISPSTAAVKREAQLFFS